MKKTTNENRLLALSCATIHTHTPSVSTESTEKRHEKCYPPLHALTRMWIKHETNLNPQLWVVYFI